MPNDVNAANREPQGLPTRMAVDANGFCWRIFEGDASWTEDGKPSWSMARTNPDNDPIPEPVTYYVPQPELLAAFIAAHELLDVVNTSEHATRRLDPDAYSVSDTALQRVWEMANHFATTAPCSMCLTNNQAIRFDHTTDDHANFEPGP